MLDKHPYLPVGEIGLDFVGPDHTADTKKFQMGIFERQLDLAIGR